MTPSNVTNKSAENNFLYSVPKAIQQVIANEYHYETQLIEKDSSMSPPGKNRFQPKINNYIHWSKRFRIICALQIFTEQIIHQLKVPVTQELFY